MISVPSRYISPVIVVILAAALPGAATAQTGKTERLVDILRPVARTSVKVENTLDLRRENETISLPWAAVQKAVPGAQPDRIRVDDSDMHELSTQLVDNDGDGKPDELLFQASFDPKSSRIFLLEAAQSSLKPVAHVFVRHDDPRDDMAWESDRIAFRIYGEGLKKTSSAMSSSGIDVWNKSTRNLIVEKWYAKGHDSYHIDTGEGADFYDVGETLGNGGEAIWQNDTIYRADNFKAWKIIANGPIRAIFELRYDPWNAGGRNISETKRFSIDGGSNMYREESVFHSSDGKDIPYVIGEVKRPGMRGIMDRDLKWAWLTGWGPVPKKDGGHGEMGTAVMLPANRLTDWKEAFNHYLALTHAKSDERVVHYIGAGWTDSGDFPTPQSWWTYLDSFAKRLATPLVVTFAQ
jgi:pectinesterase